MSKSILLGDPHCGKGFSIGKPGIGSSLNSRFSDQFNILEWVLSRAMELKARRIIITGDVFDEVKPSSMLIALFISWLKKCTDFDIDVHIITGNHDILRSGQFSMSALDIISACDMDGVFVYNDINTLNTAGATFTFMPFRDRRSFNTDSNTSALQIMQSKLQYELAGIDLNAAKIIVGHLAIEGSIPVGDEIDDMTNELFCPVPMFKGYDYTVMGHVHKPQVMSKSHYVAHIGSMDLSDFGEANHDKIIMVFDPESSHPLKTMEIPTRPLNQISISVPADISDTTSYVIKELGDKYSDLNRSIVRLSVSFENTELINMDRVAVENQLNKLGAFHVTRISEERKLAPIKRNVVNDGINNTVNETTAIKMYAEVNIEDDMRNDFVALANQIVRECAE